MSQCSHALACGDEAAQEQRGGDRAAEAAGRDVVDVRHLGIEQLVVGPPERHPPQRIVLADRAAGERRRQLVVVGVDRRDFGPQRDAGGAGERRHVGDQFRLLLVGERDRVGEDQAAFGIGVADLDGEAVARAIDVARAKGRAGDRVLDRRNEHAQPDLRAAVHQHVREREHAWPRRPCPSSC